MITDFWHPGFIHEQKPLPSSPPEYDGELLQGLIKDVTKSMSLGNPTPTEDDGEFWDNPDEKPEPESSRGTYYMLETEPDAQEALEESERGIGPKVVLVKANYTPNLECPLCKGGHLAMDCPKNEYKDFDELLRARQSLSRQHLIKDQADDSSTRVRNGKPSHGIRKTIKKSQVANCKGKTKTKAGGIADMCADPSSRDVGVEMWPCRICERNDHRTSVCPYKISIQPGEKVSSQAAIFCKCCNQIDAHPGDTDDWVEYYADIKYCGFCHALGQHKVIRYEDCPDVEGKEHMSKIRAEIRKNWGKRGAAPARTSTR